MKSVYDDNDAICLIDELKKLPLSALKASVVAINCDEVNELRKFLKKTIVSFPIVTDPSKKVSYSNATNLSKFLN